MSDTLERFRNVERRDLEQGANWGGGGASMVQIEGGDYVSWDDYTALLAFAEEQQQKLDAIPIIVKDRDDYRRKVEEQQKEIERLKDEMFTEQDIAEAYGAGRKRKPKPPKPS